MNQPSRKLKHENVSGFNRAPPDWNVRSGSLRWFCWNCIQNNTDTLLRGDYCASGSCHHSATMNADWLPDGMPVRALCSRMVCTRCGMIGADVRPDWGPHVNKRHEA